MIVKLGKSGEIRIPQSVIRKHGFKEGGSFSLSEENGILTITSLRKRDPLMDIPISEISAWLADSGIDEESRKRILHGWKDERKKR